MSHAPLFRALRTGLMATIALGLAACVLRNSTALPRVALAGAVPENRVGVATLSALESATIGLPADATFSEASLVSVDGPSLCVDVLLRTWSGAAPEFATRLRVDGTVHSEGSWTLAECALGQCLQPDTRVHTRPTDVDARLHVRGGRLCTTLQHRVDTLERELELELQQGAFSLRFRWEFDRAPSGALVPRRASGSEAPLRRSL